MTEDTRPLVQVVAGILLDQNGRYLLSSRPEGKPYAGYWEFAGGKVEAGESDFQALQREFEEELGIRILAATPWLTKVHSYEHAHVRLHFLWVEADQWTGEIQSREGQKWAWQKAGDFTVAPMLPANSALLRSLSIPRQLQGRLKIGFRRPFLYFATFSGRQNTRYDYIVCLQGNFDESPVYRRSNGKF